MNTRNSLLAAVAVIALGAAPAFAQQPDGTPGNPPSTMTGRAVDQAQGQTPQPDGTPGNPPGTAAERAADRALGTNMSGANPQGETTTTTTTTTTATDRTASADQVRDGLRASKMIGADVYNQENEDIGEVDDLLMDRDGMNPTTAVLSVGGFLGIGAKRVAVPFSELQWNAERERWILPGATRDSLRERPSFSYADDRSRAGTTTGADTGMTTTRGTMGGGTAADRPATAPATPAAPVR